MKRHQLQQIETKLLKLTGYNFNLWVNDNNIVYSVTIRDLILKQIPTFKLSPDRLNSIIRIIKYNHPELFL